MRKGSAIAMLIIACVAGAADAAGREAISYTEPREEGSTIALTQGVWDCGRLAEADAVHVMKDMSRHPARQDVAGATAGCTKTIEPERMETPWRIVRRISMLCEDRTRETAETVLPDGRRRTDVYVICGREAHALVVERDGVRRTVIDVVDLASYD